MNCLTNSFTNRRIAFALAASLAASLAAIPAGARQPPNPPPSGVVVHLFGPDSVTSNILSITPPAQAASTPPGAAQSPPATATTATPSWGAIAHQLFVTGDPATEGPAALPKGRAGQN